MKRNVVIQSGIDASGAETVGNSPEAQGPESKLTRISIKGSYRQDFMSLNYYFECLGKQDFTIDRQEVNDQIRAKIGDKIYAQVKKYFIDDDEQLLFYAGGVDSLT